MLVPTIDTVRYSFIVEWLLVMNKYVYVTGASGTGKSVIVSSLLTDI
jgi:dynein heavy chain